MSKKLKHYKMSRYKAHRKPINKRALAIVLSVFVVVALTFALGKYLDNVSSDHSDMTADSTDGVQNSPQQPYDAYEKLDVSTVCAIPLEAGAYESDENAGSAILRLCGELKSSVCITLLDVSGAPTYNSDVYNRVYSSQSGGMSLPHFMQKVEQNSICVCAVFDVSSFSDEYADVSDMRESYELSLIREAYTSGVRDMLLCGIDERDADTLYEYAKKIKEFAPELALGISMPYGELCADTILTAKLDDIFDYVAFDFSELFTHAEAGNGDSNDVTDTETAAAESGSDTAQDSGTDEPKNELSEALASSLVIMERFSARVYIDIGSTSDPENTAIAVLAEAGVKNYLLSVKQ